VVCLTFLPYSAYVSEAHFRRAQRLLARNIRQQREALGFTQEDAAHASGMAVRHYQKLEAGELNVTLRTLTKVAKALKCEVSDLFADQRQNG
jgi:transcriptional regulator with XRE-family HTH domain